MAQITVRLMQKADIDVIYGACSAENWHKPRTLFQHYWDQMTKERGVLIVGEIDGTFAGYITINWQSNYPPFREANIPELVDFNVMPRFRQLGVGAAIMDFAEDLIAQRSPVAGIGVGLTHDYGAAQRLYVKRGYIPDGRGIFKYHNFVSIGDKITVGHDVALYFTKRLIANNTIDPQEEI